MSTIFTVTNEDLNRLSPSEAVDCFRELLWAEATALGIQKNLIDVPSAIYVDDGGIDAEVQDAPASQGQGIIKPGLTRYQIKTGNFSLSGDSDIREILLNRSGLKPRIKTCLDQESTLVVVLFGSDNPEREDQQVISRFKEKLAEVNPGYREAKIEIWRQNHLIGFLKPFPSLALQISQREQARFQTHRSWSQDSEMRRHFQAGPHQEEFIANLRQPLRETDEAVHIHVQGEPGIGKTRLVLEATRTEDLQPLVIYCSAASIFKDSDLMNEILRDDNPFSAIVVIDECDPGSRTYIWDKLQYRGPRIKLITIYNEYERIPDRCLDAPSLDNEQLSGIIQRYGILRDSSDRWVGECSGSPRVAHVIGENLGTNPEDILREPGTVNVWDRYITGGDNPDSLTVRQRRVVLLHIALFKRFGYGHSLIAEAQAIAKKIEEVDPQITWPRFQEIIRNLRERRILQGENTLYITPKLLQIKLWIDWQQTYGVSFNYGSFVEGLPPNLVDWFNEMFEYATNSEAASRIVQELLGEDGPFQKDSYLATQLGSRFFLALAKADPSSAIQCLRQTIGTWSKADLSNFTSGRREVVWALEGLAIHRELFCDAARLLLALGEAENETYSNSASGVFAALFSSAYGEVAPTEAPPEERFPVLLEAFASDSREKRLLAIRACDQALEAHHFVRMIGNEWEGLRKEFLRWTPKTYGELYEAYRHVWKLLSEQVATLPEEESLEAVAVLLKKARGLGTIPSLSEMVIETLRELNSTSSVDRKKILAPVVSFLHYEGKALPLDIRKNWEEFRNRLTGNDFPSHLRRYVGMDLIEDQFDEQGNNREGQTQKQIEELALQAAKSPEALLPELAWLVTTEAQNGYRFGYALGKKDKEYSLMPQLIEAQRSAEGDPSVFFLGGYFRSFFEANPTAWEEQLERLAEEPGLDIWIPELTWRSGISDRAAMRVLDLAERGVVSSNDLRIFCFGRVISNCSEGVLERWLRFLLENPSRRAIQDALKLYQSYYLHNESKCAFPKELARELLLQDVLFQEPDEGQRDTMEEYYWREIAEAFVKAYPEDCLPIAETMLSHFGDAGTVVGGYASETQSVLNEILRLMPEKVWEIIAKYVGPPIDSRAFRITRWLRGDEELGAGGSALSTLPPENLWQWVENDIETRAWYLATFVPKTLFREKERICLAREVLIRYGSQKKVQNSLMSNFSTEGWTGPESLHLQKKKQALLDFREDETVEIVKEWIDEYVDSLDKEIDRAKIRAEREPPFVN